MGEDTDGYAVEEGHVIDLLINIPEKRLEVRELQI